MATITLSRPVISSPLAGSSSHNSGQVAQRSVPGSRRTVGFPSSRAIRPFPTISQSFQKTSTAPSKGPVKLIQPPQNQKGTFVLNLTQAEFSRQD